MAKAWQQYASEMFNKFGYLATWTPGVQMELGDVGVVKDKLFTRITTLANLEIPFEVRPDASKESQKHSSSGSVSITFKAAGKAPALGSALSQAEAGFSIDFKKSNSTVYEALGCLAPSINDQVAIGKRIQELYDQGDWNKDWAVVTELVTADSATVLISNSSSAKIELSASGNVATGGVSLADLTANLQIAYSKDMQTVLVSKEGLTPLFKARALKSNGPIGPFFKSENVLGLTAFDTGTHNSTLAAKDLHFGYVRYDDIVQDDLE